MNDPIHRRRQALAKVIFSTCFLALFWSARSEGATVQAIGRSFVVINAGTMDGLRHGDLLCIVNASGREVGCGNLGETRPRLSELRLPSWTAARVKIGDNALGKALASDGKQQIISQSEILTFVRVVEKIRGQEKVWVAPSRSLVVNRALGLPPATLWFRAARVKASILATSKLPFSYKVPKYNVRGELDDTEELWTADREVTQAPWGSELSVALPFTDHIALVTSVHIRKLPSEEITVSYDARDPSQGAIGRLSGLTYGGGLDLEFGRPILPALEMIFSIGGEGDMSRIDFKEQTMSPLDEETVGALNAKLLVWSSRIGFDFAWILGGGLAADLGIKFLIPHAEKADTTATSPGLKSTLSEAQRDTSSDVLKAALDHHKAKIGSQVYFGLSYGF